MEAKALSVASPTNTPLLRFDVFKGVQHGQDSVHRLRSIGQATRPEGRNTFTLYLNSLVDDVFFLLPAQERFTTAEYVIMTRQPSRRPGRKYVWKPVGEGRVVSDARKDLIQLSFDLFAATDLFMSLVPIRPSYEIQLAHHLRAVLES